MPRGQPDFGMYAAESVVAGLSDMAELAVRLGSISIFDRRGKVIDFDDFEGVLLKWRAVGAGLATAKFSSASAKSGSQSILLNVKAALPSTIELYRGIRPLLSKRLGLEIAYAKPDTTAILVIRLAYFDGTNITKGEIRLHFSTLDLWYVDEDNVLQ